MAKKKKDIEFEVIKGILRLHPRGFGFVQPEDDTRYKQDIFIPKHLTQNAVDGDVVEVQLDPTSFSEKGPEGQIISILNRARSHIAGIVHSMGAAGEAIVYVPILGTDKRVVTHATAEFPLKLGDRLVMEVLDWGSKETETICRVSHHLGHISDPSTDIKAAIEEFEIRSTFPSKAILEAESYGKQVSKADIAQREDIRDTVCVTIDPDTAKDFDDALSLTLDKKGNYHLGVHIADVSHYVRPKTALDEEAALRANSTYLPGTCIPMLPNALSENLCSLRPNVNRLTASVFMTFDKTGALLDYRIARTVIKSKKRFTYKEAKKVLDGALKSPHKELLDLMVELCKILKKKRYERGSLEFSIPDLVIKIDEKGVPYGTEFVDYDITHQMVEEFMLKANELVAQHLSNMGKGLTYRVHEEPSADNMKEFSRLASAFGYTLHEKPTQQQLQEFFDEAIHTSFGQYLATSYIRKMRLAMYSADNIGHYGLGLEYYCHFTSPIRRYVDLVVHRILFGDSLTQEKLETISNHCSETERISEKAENRVTILKKLRLLDEIHKKDPYRQYEAVITRVRPFGIYFDLTEYLLDSFLHISNLENDYFIYNDENQLLKGTSTNIVYSVGTKITVMVKEIDLIYLENHWSIVGERKKKKDKKKRRRRR